MKVIIELKNCDSDMIKRNIEAQERAIKGKSLPHDFVLLIDTKSILTGIENFIEEEKLLLDRKNPKNDQTFK